MLLLASTGLRAQQVTQVVFNLYTDSLKKGFYNYISVDGQYADGRWQPLDSTHLVFSANTGHFKGNDLFIDSTYTFDSVIVKVSLRSNPKVWKEAIIYIRKRGFTEPLKSAEEIMGEPKPRSRRKTMLS
ncbi:hypothetical protein BUE76_15275 [Cnuella takakiae]|nr:hypothetical protein BUE76_15275 [Cnuella takakiae]